MDTNKESQVSSQLSRLQEVTANLNNVCIRLETSLESITVKEPDSEPSASEGIGGLVDLAKKLYDVSSTLEFVNHRIESLLSRLEL